MAGCGRTNRSRVLITHMAMSAIEVVAGSLRPELHRRHRLFVFRSCAAKFDHSVTLLTFGFDRATAGEFRSEPATASPQPVVRSIRDNSRRGERTLFEVAGRLFSSEVAKGALQLR